MSHFRGNVGFLFLLRVPGCEVVSGLSFDLCIPPFSQFLFSAFSLALILLWPLELLQHEINTVVEGQRGHAEGCISCLWEPPLSPAWQIGPPRRHLWHLTRVRWAPHAGTGGARPEVCICPDSGNLSVSQLMLSACLGRLVLSMGYCFLHTHRTPGGVLLA